MAKKVVPLARKIIFRSAVFGALIFFALGGFDFIIDVAAEKPEVQVSSDYYYNVMAHDRVVALTFDDGPDPEMTLEILKILQKHEVPATFFFVGSQALRYPDIVKEVHQSGYEIGNHSYTHSENVHTSRERVQYEIDITNKILKNITGEETILYRPPFLLDIGSDPLPDEDEHSVVLDWIMEDGYIPVGADIDSLDWKAESAQDVVANVLSGKENGHIVLLHDGGSSLHTLDALDNLITALKKNDFRFETVSDVIGLNAAEKMLVSTDLAMGMTDEETGGDVTRLQTFLLKTGHFQQMPTGYFGEITRQALMEWQKEQWLIRELGYVGEASRNQIADSLPNAENLPDQGLHFSYTQAEEAMDALRGKTIQVSAFTRNNITLVSQIILVLVLGRLVIVAALLCLSWILPGRQSLKHWRGGVSVLVPAYNEEKNIEAALRSLLQVKRKKLEIIVIDDGSLDKTYEIATEIEKNYPDKIKVIHQANSGKAAALNRGIEEAKFGVVVTVDADSFLEKKAVNLLVRPLGDKSVAAVAGKVLVSKSKNVISWFQHLEYVIAQNVDKQAFNVINAVNVVPGPIGAWRKSDLIAMGGFSSDTLVEDHDMTLAMLSARKRVVYEPRAVAYTETPFTVGDFIKQRARWVFGGIQCLFKYREKILNPAYGSLGLIVMPNSIIYSIILPIAYPLMDILFLGWLLTSMFQQLWLLFAIYIFIDLFYAIAGFANERKNTNLLLWLPLQRLFYRVFMYYVVMICLIKAIEGGEMLWNMVLKRGQAKQHLLELENKLATTELES